MRDGRTKKQKLSGSSEGLAEFLSSREASLVILAGGARGMEHRLDQSRVRLGRGPGVDLAFDDDQMSREHAVLEFANGRFRIRDAESTNGTLVNGTEIETADLKHGDRIQIGHHVFGFILEDRQRSPVPYVLPDA